MLFRKDIEPSCSYCKRGTPLSDSEVVCSRKGIVAAARMTSPSFTPKRME